MNQIERILEGLKSGDVQTRLYTPEVRLLDKGNRVFRFVASTRGIDSYKTRLIDWNYDRYMKNPVVLFTHNPFIPPVARTLKIEDDGEQVRTDIQFPPENLYDFADILYRLTEADFLRGISVGFRHGRAQPNPELQCVDLFENELQELSLVGVPSNPDSLAAAMRSGQIPERYQDFFIANKAAQIQTFKDVTDLDGLRIKIEKWQSSTAPIEVLEVVSGSTENDNPTIKEPTVDELLARCEALTTMAEDMESELEKIENRVATLTTENESLKEAANKSDEVFYIDAIRSIAGIVGFDVRTAYTKEDLVNLASNVQGLCVKVGSGLNRHTHSVLQSVVATLEGLLGAATQENDDEEPAKLDDDKRNQYEAISERIRAIENRLMVIRSDDARELARPIHQVNVSSDVLSSIKTKLEAIRGGSR